MIRVLLVDDSAVVCKIFAEQLSREPDMRVVGSARDPYEARDMVVALKPDVLTLDMEMPRMDGLTFLGKLMHYYPMPVLVISSLTFQGSELGVRAMELGAVDVIDKTGFNLSGKGGVLTLAGRVRQAAMAKVRPMRLEATPGKPAALNLANHKMNRQLVAIGASTGGTEAMAYLLPQLPQDMPATVIVQHMPPYFTKAFAGRLNNHCSLEVRELQGEALLKPGLVLIAPGNYHMVVKRCGGDYWAVQKEGPPVFYQRPSVDVLFRSVAKEVGANAVGVLLTGMGSDGATGLLEMKSHGARTLAQDKESSVVYGMPGKAVELGAVGHQVSLEDMPAAIVETVNQVGVRGPEASPGTTP